MSTFDERQAARRARLRPIDREKIDRRVAEDAARMRGSLARLEPGRWHWVAVAGRKWPGRVLAVLEGVGAAVGLAELGTVQILPAEQIGHRLRPEELSDHLRREPTDRLWPTEDELADGLLALNRAGIKSGII